MSRRTSSSLTRRSPGARWRIRVILAHGYFHVEQDIIGNIVSQAVPVLRAQLQEILHSLPDVDD